MMSCVSCYGWSVHTPTLQMNSNITVIFGGCYITVVATVHKFLLSINYCITAAMKHSNIPFHNCIITAVISSYTLMIMIIT